MRMGAVVPSLVQALDGDAVGREAAIGAVLVHCHGNDRSVTGEPAASLEPIGDRIIKEM